MTGHWLHTWAAAPQLAEPDNLPPAPFTRDGLVLAGGTLRQTVRVCIGGPRLRLRLSNAFGDAALGVDAACVALPAGGRAGARAIAPGTSREVTFAGRAAVRIPVGAERISDPVGLAVGSGDNLTVTLHLAAGQPATGVTAHPGSRTTSHLVAGDHVHDADLPAATAVEHWYFLSGLEVWAVTATAVAVTLGDSLTDGRGSTTDGNDRWPDRLADRLRAHPPSARIAVVNQGIGGNRLLADGLGPHAVGRIGRDVLGISGVAWLLVFEGVNDIGTAQATPAAQKQVAGDLIDGYDRIVRRARAAGVRVYGATITPFGGNEGYDDPGGLREATRCAVNAWIRDAGRFDAVLDFDRAVCDPARPDRLRPALDTGDHLHLNPGGYRALADAVPVRLFAPRRAAPLA
jgi:lysophospholipase L1-like esterase